MSKSKGHQSWREWGDYRKQRELTKDFNNWKQDAVKEMEEVPGTDALYSVYIIINEWTDIAGNTSSEVVGGKFFASEDEAWGALDEVADAHDVELADDETSIQLEDHKAGLQNEEYRIEELTR